MRHDADWLRWTVAFIIGRNGEPIGTGFFVHLPMRVSHRPWHLYATYLVTAAHVVRPSPVTFVRVHRRTPGIRVEWGVPAGSVEDIEIPRESWYYPDDPGVDIAVVPVNISDADYWYEAIDGQTKGDEGEIPEFPRVTSWDTQGLDRSVGIGDRVFFMGMLAHVERMGEENIPMARGGTLGALWQRDVPIELGGKTRITATAHLIDCNAYRGFSGSPVFAHRTVGVLEEKRHGFTRRREEGTRYEHREEEQSPFLGVLAGHFPWLERVGPRDDPGAIELPVNAGVAVVIPCQFLWQILGKELFVKDREKRKERFEAEKETEALPGTATPDSVRPGPDPERLNLDKDWEEAVEKAMRKKKPEEGWPEEED